MAVAVNFKYDESLHRMLVIAESKAGDKKVDGGTKLQFADVHPCTEKDYAKFSKVLACRSGKQITDRKISQTEQVDVSK